MASRKKLSWGIKTIPQYTTYEDILRVWKEADALPVFEHAWVFDHFMPIGNADPSGPCLEGWTLLAALAAQTERLRVGAMVMGNTYRHPAVLANMGATLDIISRGRLDFGLGAGWNELEHSAYGIPLYAPGERLAHFAEACEVIKLLWTEKAPDFNGKYYQLKGAFCNPSRCRSLIRRL
jgi:alkanesulfonate monooxygenase SsuD/methylene tetrahydromethanopterin reductase-like flavin-dependent oxidoreductase (luciferase family)